MRAWFPLFLLALGAFVLPAEQVRADAKTEAVVRAYFSDVPIMIKIAECESRFRQFADSGNPLHGGWDNKMVGVYQIYANIHRNDAAALGHDIETLEGNVAYARYLYDKKGTDPWMSSFPCWNDRSDNSNQPPQTITTSSQPGATALTMNLSFGMEHEQVRLLQKFLNSAGFSIAQSGPGSPGQETMKFGSLTREAVKKFQCAKGIICTGDEYTTAYGYVGPRTRAELLAAAENPQAIATAPAAAPKPDNSAEISSIKAQIAALQKRLAELEAASQ
jgi:hypothetical protein